MGFVQKLRGILSRGMRVERVRRLKGVGEVRVGLVRRLRAVGNESGASEKIEGSRGNEIGLGFSEKIEGSRGMKVGP